MLLILFLRLSCVLPPLPVFFGNFPPQNMGSIDDPMLIMFYKPFIKLRSITYFEMWECGSWCWVEPLQPLKQLLLNGRLTLKQLSCRKQKQFLNFISILNTQERSFFMLCVFDLIYQLLLYSSIFTINNQNVCGPMTIDTQNCTAIHWC